MRVDIRHLYRGDEVPAEIGETDFLVVLGGPMGVADIPSGKYPFLEKEVTLLQAMIARDLPTLGICLGAQLIAHAGGAKVYPNVRPGAKPEDPGTPRARDRLGPR